jgi:elongation factor P
MALSTSEFKNGLKIEIAGEPFTIVNFQHVKPGKGGAFVRTKIKNLRNGKVIEKTFRAGEKVVDPDIEDRKMQYLYADGDSLVFMDTETYDQLPFSQEQVGDARKYLTENIDVSVLFWNGKPINIDLPPFIESEIVKCDPGMKGDTAQGGTKPATVETGAVVTVPLFLKEGERIRIDTRTGEYVERVG